MTGKVLTEEEWRPLLTAQDLVNSPGHVFRVLENKIHERYFQLTPRADISPRQIAVLLRLYQVGGATQTELATMINLDRSTLSEMSNRMCDRGLLDRSVHAHDRRATTLQVTPAGREALMATFPSVLQAQRELLAPLPDEYRPLFHRCLAILYHHHTAAEPAPEPEAKPAKRGRPAKRGPD